MKKLSLENTSFRYLEKSFREWLDILGYSEITVYNMPNLIREFLHYLENQGKTQIRQLDNQDIHDYYQRLKERANQRKEGGALSNAHINKHIQALRKFTEYLRKVGRLELPSFRLTLEEIQQLFNATEQTITYNYHKDQPAFQARDKAMLAIFYGCGLRRNEGVNLQVSDINFDRSILHVRKGKGYKERFVPISKTNLKYLQDYVFDHRPNICPNVKSEALFISKQDKAIQGQTLYLRLKSLQEKTQNPDLMEKEIGLHTLRHSIATHLLQAGMKLESISRFLGHSSLESTQVYTHLNTEAFGEGAQSNTKNQPFSNLPGRQAGAPLFTTSHE